MDKEEINQAVGTKRKEKQAKKEEKKPKAQKNAIPKEKKQDEDKVEPKTKKNKKPAAAGTEEVKGDEPVPPKRAWPAFFFFQNQQRAQVKEENPDLNQKELVAKLGEVWRSMSDAEKAKYFALEKESKDKYVKLKEEYSKVKAEYDKTAPSAPAAKKSGKEKKSKNANAVKGPKRAWPPFFFFQEARRAGIKSENPDKTHKEVVSMLGEEWRGMSEEQKQPYVDKSTEDKKRYEKEKAEFTPETEEVVTNKKEPKSNKRKAIEKPAKETSNKRQKTAKEPAAKKEKKKPARKQKKKIISDDDSEEEDVAQSEDLAESDVDDENMDDEPVVKEESDVISPVIKDKQVNNHTAAPDHLQNTKPEQVSQNLASEDDPLKLDEENGSDELPQVIGE